MTVSSLASKTVAALSSNYSSGRSGKSICKITPHHMAGKLTAEACAKLFQVSGKNASANYCIGYDGDIVCSVTEENRSWCSSSASNDRQAITIECSNSSIGGDYPISDATWNSLVNLCVDICTRYGFTLEYTGDSSGSLTEHRMFSSTACPGEYLHSRMSQLASEVNAKLKGEDTVTVPDNVTLNEYSGSNRYETAAMIVAKEIELASTPFEGVIIANGEDSHFPDSLAASGLAGALGYPILLTAADSLTDSAAEVLTQLKESATGALDIIVIGDTSAISESLRKTLASYGEVDSTAQGANRYETASAIYDLGRGKWNTEYTIITTGENFPDGLSIGPFAAKTGCKVVLINGKSGISPNTWVEVLESENVVVLGDTATICECVENGLIELFGSDHVERLAGPDRYSTSAKIATWALSHGLSANGVGFATGEKPADALAASFLLGMTGSILLLVGSGSNTEALKVVSSNAASISEISIFGATSSVSTSTRNSIYSALA